MKNICNYLYKIIIFIIILLIFYLIIDNYNHNKLKISNTKYNNELKLYSDLDTFENCKNINFYKRTNLIKKTRGNEFKLNLKIKDKDFDLYILDDGTDLKEDYNLVENASNIKDNLNYYNGSLICKLVESLNPKIRLHTYKICDYKHKVYLKDYIEAIENIKKENPNAIIISNIIPFDEINPENLLIFCPGNKSNKFDTKFIQIGSYNYNGKYVNNGIVFAPCENIKINNDLYSSKLLSVVLFCVYACSNFDIKNIDEIKRLINIFESNNDNKLNENIFKKYI